MKKLLDLQKKMLDIHGELMRDEKGKELTFGKLFYTILAGSSKEESARTVELAKKIKDAFDAGKGEVEFDENSAIDFIKRKVDAYPANAWTDVLVKGVFEKTEEEYKHRNDKK